ncbi:hypothetical protein [Streptomyces apocyni]|uniref:hypothetical protein n=1 Tax=Streptomyces apocyni TaxID=2654677 RepID=UPI0012EA31CF|nr:hypothetical protein [Streptomyces apocyni]
MKLGAWLLREFDDAHSTSAGKHPPFADEWHTVGGRRPYARQEYLAWTTGRTATVAPAQSDRVKVGSVITVFVCTGQHRGEPHKSRRVGRMKIINDHHLGVGLGGPRTKLWRRVSDTSATYIFRCPTCRLDIRKSGPWMKAKLVGGVSRIDISELL